MPDLQPGHGRQRGVAAGGLPERGRGADERERGHPRGSKRPSHWSILERPARMPSSSHAIDHVLAQVEAAADEIVRFTQDLVRIPTINPPGDEYEACAAFIGNDLSRRGYDVEYIVAQDRPEHTLRHPRVNVIGSRRGSSGGPVVHLNGHFDVVPAGSGWTVDPFAAIVRDGRIFGRGVCDMKAGIAAAVFAAEAIARAGVTLPGVIEISGTVDEESGGFAGVAHLARVGRISSARTDFVIIPEPLNVDRVCIGHRGVYWSELTTFGRIAHGSMPFLGVSAIDAMAAVLAAIRGELQPRLADAGHRRCRSSRTAPAPPRSTSTASTAASRSTASRRRASRTAAAPCSIAAFSSRRASSPCAGRWWTWSHGRWHRRRASSSSCAI
mgnify:CR=1 FL=1